MSGRRPVGAGPVALAWQHVRIGALNELQYRANFWVQLVNSLVALATGLVAIALVYGQTNSLGGWSRPELLAVMGVHILIGGVVRTFIQPNMNRLMEDIREGTLDYALTRPADAQLLVSVRQVSFWNLIDVIIGAGVVAWAVVSLTTTVGPIDIVLFLAALLCGMVIMYCIWLSFTTLSFRLVDIDEAMQMLTGIYEAARWPVTVYPAWLRGVLTFLVPLAFAVTVPAEAVATRLNWVSLPIGFVVTIIAVGVTRFLWRLGIRGYSGASA